ncbi:MAG TPA: lysozyme inhibitor LprI family protein, partial [Terriglobales bacterium]|nr:lysozyme inhibitor LprI family protein [Terriglobales bacterium]
MGFGQVLLMTRRLGLTRVIAAGMLSASVILMLGQRPSAAASFDCSKATQPLDQHICHNAELSHMDEDLAAGYGKAKAALGPDGQKLLQDSQRDWLAFAHRICKTRLDAKTAKAVQQTADECLQTEYQERQEDLGGVVSVVNGFTFQRVDLYALAPDKIDPDIPAGSRAGFSYRRISFP